MLDKNKNEFGKGIVKYDNMYHKVFNINETQLIVSRGYANLRHVQASTRFFGIWDVKPTDNMVQIEYESLGVFDSEGREFKVDDTIFYDSKECKVIGALKNINRDNRDYVYYKNDSCEGGWDFGNSNSCTILHSALEKPVEENPESALSLLQDFLSELEKSLEIVNKKIREPK